MAGGKKQEDSRDVGDAMLVKDVMDGDTIWSIRDGVFGVQEGGVGLVVLNEDGVIIVGGDDCTSRGKIGAKGVLGNWDMGLVGSHIVDESAGMEKFVGDMDGNGADLV